MSTEGNNCTDEFNFSQATLGTEPFFENNDNFNRIRRTEFVEERGCIRRPKTSQNQDLEKLMHAITATMNPFSAMVDKENLFNISTGKADSEETTGLSDKCCHIGSSARDAFVQDCCDDPSRYSKLI